MNNLYFTVGSARSGKSTFSKTWIDNQMSKGIPSVVLNEDLIRLAHHKQRYIGAAEPFIHASAQLFLKSLLLGGYDILYDETNTSVNSIKNIFSICPTAKPYVFLESVDVLIDRAHKSGQSDLVEQGVIHKHCGQIYRLSVYEPLQKPGVYKTKDIVWKTFPLCDQIYGDGIIANFNHVRLGDFSTHTIKADHELYQEALDRSESDFIDRIKGGIELIRMEVLNK